MAEAINYGLNSVASNKEGLRSTASKILGDTQEISHSKSIFGSVPVLIIIFFAFELFVGRVALGFGVDVGILFGIIFIFSGFKEFSLTQAIEDSPTAKIDAAADGLTEVSGAFVPESGVPLKSFISASDCIYYQLDLQHLVHTKNGSYWETTQSFGFGTPALLTDGTGYLAIDLANSDINLTTGERMCIVDDKTNETFIRDQEYKNFVSYLSSLNGTLPDLAKSGIHLSSTSNFKFEIFGGAQVAVLESIIPTGGNFFVMGRIDGTAGSFNGKPLKKMTQDPGTGLLSIRVESKETIEKTDKRMSAAVLVLGLILVIGGLVYLGFK